MLDVGAAEQFVTPLNGLNPLSLKGHVSSKKNVFCSINCWTVFFACQGIFHYHVMDV